MKVTFLHPDLGIGGAERLVVSGEGLWVCRSRVQGCSVVIRAGGCRPGTASQEPRRGLCNEPLLAETLLR